MLGEPKGWKQLRNARMGMLVPERQVGSADDVECVDAIRIARGELPTEWSQRGYRLLNHALRERKR